MIREKGYDPNRKFEAALYLYGVLKAEKVDRVEDEGLLQILFYAMCSPFSKTIGDPEYDAIFAEIEEEYVRSLSPDDDFECNATPSAISSS
jgi:hypothetical protein